MWIRLSVERTTFVNNFVRCDSFFLNRKEQVDGKRRRDRSHVANDSALNIELGLAGQSSCILPPAEERIVIH